MEKEELTVFAARLESRKDFVEFLNYLKADFLTHKEEWESWTVLAYLEALGAFVNDVKSSRFNELDLTPCWSLFANLLLTASVYE